MVGFTLPKRFRSNLPSLCSGKMKRSFFFEGQNNGLLFPILFQKRVQLDWVGFIVHPLFGKVSSTLTFFGLGGLKPPSCTTIVDASQKSWEPQLKGECFKNSEESRRRHPTCRFEWLDCFQAELMKHAAEGYWCGALNGLIHPK